MKRPFLFIIAFFIVVFITGCGSDKNNDYDVTEEHEGIIANITKADTRGDDDEGYRMLVISDINVDDISGKTEDELTKIAQENNGADYYMNEDIYDEDKFELNQGVKVKVYWGGDEGQSNPPVRKAEKISVIPN
ncbi:hypothetical protein FH966_03580 [Lentibacillus cibarius]|uniref:DUF3221 domain-containing protein n=1 Tax=Lentibacillus cibarius TaxID=2583219 RepID=A0A549YG62_9BACI|nr:DUF3221 domain-containing protein [Lentibacillus cibarius]TRM10873.1 hypothetical protein FH966_03580 [Lentibacillus cibarius]